MPSIPYANFNMRGLDDSKIIIPIDVKELRARCLQRCDLCSKTSQSFSNWTALTLLWTCVTYQVMLRKSKTYTA